MRLVLKATFALLSTLAITTVAAQCGSRGCGYPGKYYNRANNNYPANYSEGYSAGYDQSGYYDQQGNRYHGNPDYQQGWDQNHQMHDGHYHDMNHGQYGHDHDHQGHYGYDYPMDDHPVTDHNGEHVRYYGKPGPDYNTGKMQQNNQQRMMQQRDTSSMPQNGQKDMDSNANSTMQTSYRSNASKQNWNQVANADSMMSSDHSMMSSDHEDSHDMDHHDYSNMSSKRDLSGGGSYHSMDNHMMSDSDKNGATNPAASNKW